MSEELEKGFEEIEVESDEKISTVDKTIAKAKADGKFVIEEEDFVMIALDLDCLFDLYLMKVIRPKGKPERTELRLAGYGIQLKNCITKITRSRLKRKYYGQSIDLETFYKDYVNYNDKLKIECFTKLKPLMEAKS